MKTITIDDALSWVCCYTPERLQELYPTPKTTLEVLTLRDGPWADVPDQDRIWTVAYHGGLSDKVLRLFACECAERALLSERAADREPHANSWKAIEVARRYVNGEATKEELSAAATAACVYTDIYADAYAASTAASASPAHAAESAAYAAYAAARDTYADIAVSAVANAVVARCQANASTAERRWQIDRLIEIVKENA